MTDRDICQAVLAALAADPRVQAKAVGVTVHDGVVTLAGRVSSFAEKTAAEAAAERTPGVRAVAREIEVCGEDESFGEDEVIGARIARYLGWNASVSNDAVHVGVDSGWVTLVGKVDWEFQGLALERFVLRIEGVKGVSNLIEARRLATAERLCDWVRRTLHAAPPSGPERMTLQ